MTKAHWPKDALKRHLTANVFEKIASKSTDKNIFLVHAGFGQGKTFFVENWKNDLTTEGWPHVVFNAWKHDFSDNPLAAFISSIADQVEKLDPNERRDALKKLKSFSKKAAPILLKSGVRMSAKLISLGAIDGDIDTVREIFADQGISAAISGSDEVIEAFSKAMNQEKSFNDLSDSFAGLVNEIRGASEDRPVLIIIDELDRCRPSFAFDLLEDIKHIL